MKKLISILIISVALTKSTFARSVEEGIIGVLGSCAQPPNRVVSVCSDKADFIKIESIKVGLDIKSTETFSNLCLMVCLNPNTFSEVVELIRGKKR